MTKTFVLRPNALLSSPNSTQKFGDDNIVVIPRSVLDEVQTRRNMSNEKAKVRRRILEYIRSFDYNELTSTGVRQSNGSILKICKLQGYQVGRRRKRNYRIPETNPASLQRAYARWK